MMAGTALRAFYTRSDARCRPRVRPEDGELACNRLAVFWRPLLDMGDTKFAPVSLRTVRPVAMLLRDPDPGRRSWFSKLGVAGVRHQVVRHARLPRYECRDPIGLSPELRTPEWQVLVECIDRFEQLDDAIRALVVFQIAQLSFCRFALKLAGAIVRDGDPMRDHYAYEVARVCARMPARVPEALQTFQELAESSCDRRLALASCFQGIGHALRNHVGIRTAQGFESRGRSIIAARAIDEAWHSGLVLSRFHRALAVLRLAQERVTEARAEVAAALRHHDEISGRADGEIERLLLIENRLYILELELNIAQRDSVADTRALCRAILDLDPYSVDARLRAGDGFSAIGDYAEAARCYRLAGELGTVAGAVGWFRAGQCYALTGERGGAANAMGRCLELDASAVEPRLYLERVAK